MHTVTYFFNYMILRLQVRYSDKNNLERETNFHLTITKVQTHTQGIIISFQFSIYSLKLFDEVKSYLKKKKKSPIVEAKY